MFCISYLYPTSRFRSTKVKWAWFFISRHLNDSKGSLIHYRSSKRNSTFDPICWPQGGVKTNLSQSQRFSWVRFRWKHMVLWSSNVPLRLSLKVIIQKLTFKSISQVFSALFCAIRIINISKFWVYSGKDNVGNARYRTKHSDNHGYIQRIEFLFFNKSGEVTKSNISKYFYRAVKLIGHFACERDFFCFSISYL